MLPPWKWITTIITMDCQAFNSGCSSEDSDRPLGQALISCWHWLQGGTVVTFLFPDNGHLLDLKTRSFSSPGEVCFGSRVLGCYRCRGLTNHRIKRITTLTPHCSFKLILAFLSKEKSHIIIHNAHFPSFKVPTSVCFEGYSVG